MPRKISCVIPCYCSDKTIAAVVAELEAAIATRSDCFDYELILVNDGSPDGGTTISALQSIAATHERVLVVDLARNFGQHAAIMAGFRQVTGDIVVCLDDDGQTPADELFKLIDKLDDGNDIVFAKYPHKQHNAFRNLGSRFNAWCNHRFMGIPKDLQTTSYFACRRFVIDNALAYKNPYPFVEGLLIQSVQTYANVEVHHRARELGTSGYSLKKLIGLWSNGFTAFSVLPLRFASVCGFIVAMIGFIFTIAIIIQRLVVPGVNEGWTSIMAGLLVIGGLLMLMIGLVGEYVGRIYISINNLPQYVVRDITDNRGMASCPGGAGDIAAGIDRRSSHGSADGEAARSDTRR